MTVADSEARLHDCERQHNQLLVLYTISAALNCAFDLDTLLKIALERVLEALQLDVGDVRLVQDGQLVLKAVHGVSSDFLAAEQTIPLGYCQCGRAAAQGTVLIAESPDHLPLLGATCVHDNLATVLSVPICVGDRVIGLLRVASRTPRSFTKSDWELLSALGHQIGVAFERALLYEELKTLNATLEARVAERTRELEAAREALLQKAEALRAMRIEERRIEERTRSRIAHDLHDGVQQLIIGALFEVQAARDLLMTRPQEAATKLGEVQNLLRRLETEMRGAIFSLRPMALDTHGLAPALRELAAEFSRSTRIPCDLHVIGTPYRFAPDAEVVAFRIVQEALHNLGRHARASRAEIGVSFGPRQVVVEIRDDGIGFDPAAIDQDPHSHLGLIGMHERAESVGGTLTLWSRPGRGTRITLQLPVAPEDVSDSHESYSRFVGG